MVKQEYSTQKSYLLDTKEKYFLRKPKLKETTITRPTLQEMLKGAPLLEMKRQKYTKL